MTTYERVFHTSEYFIYDPAEQRLRGWRLNGKQRYHEIEPNDKGWLLCEQLGLWLGTWQGKFQEKQEVYLRFYDKDGNLVLSAEERAAMEHRHADAEKRRANAEKQRADAEKQRANAADAELMRLKTHAKNSAS